MQIWDIESEEQFHRRRYVCVIALVSSRGVCDLSPWSGMVSEKRGWYWPGCSGSSEERWRCWGWCLEPTPLRLTPLPVALRSHQLVVFHQFFQSSIDSGFCILEARALWCWLWHCAQKNTESWQQRSHKHKAWGFCPLAVLFLPSCFITIRGRLWGICQVVFPVPRLHFTFSFNAYFKSSVCREIQTLFEWLTHERSPLGPVVLFIGYLLYFWWRKPWLGFSLWLLLVNCLVICGKGAVCSPLPFPAAEYWSVYWSFHLVW